MKFGKNGKEFGDNSHSSWETFMKTVKQKDYQNVINGTKYSGLEPGSGDW